MEKDLNLKIENWPIDKLIPFARNPRKHSDEQIAQVAGSIKEFGFVNPILVAPDGVIIAGHARLAAARKLGRSEVPVIVLPHLSDTQRRAYVIADNRLAMKADDDLELLRGLLEELRDEDFNLGIIGFSADELVEIFQDVTGGGGPGLVDEDAVPEPLEQPVAVRGDLWILGNHRLLCGDSANPEDVARLLNGAVIDLVNTDPPYNVRVEPRSNNAIAAGLSSFELHNHQKFDLKRGRVKAVRTTKKMRPKDRPLANDFMKDQDYEKLLLAWFQNMANALKPGGAFYLWGGYANCGNYPPALAECGLYFSQAIIWVKNQPVLTRKDFMGAHEWCFYGWKEGAGHWFNPEYNNVRDVWEVDKVPQQKMVHLTEKPVELAERAMIYSTRPGERVLDLFGGSGSTLIAAEKTGRIAYLMEIDPAYVDVIVRRWQEYTGKDAILDGDGRTFAEVEAERTAKEEGPVT
jgi:DNA modification methylase